MTTHDESAQPHEWEVEVRRVIVVDPDRRARRQARINAELIAEAERALELSEL